jgi:chromosome segregation protein
LEQARTEKQEISGQQRQDKEKLTLLVSTANNLEPQLQGSRSGSDKAYSLLNQDEQAMQAWQTEWDKFNETASEYTRQQEIGQARSEHLGLNIEDAEQRRDSLNRELEAIDCQVISKNIEQQGKQVDAAEKSQEQLNKDFENVQKHILALRKQTQVLIDELNEQRMLQHKLEGRLTSLETLQQSALGQDQKHVVEWLKNSGLSNHPRLAQQINADPQWADAVEMALGKYLQDICVDDIDDFVTKANKLKQGQVGLISSESDATEIKPRFPCLADKVQSPFPVQNLLAGIYIAKDTTTALNMRNKLTGNESVITRDGLWLGTNWMRVLRGKNEQGEMLSREQEVQKIKSEHAEYEQRIQKLVSEIDKSQNELEQNEKQLVTFQAELLKNQKVLSDHHTKFVTSQTQLAQFEARVEQIQEEIDSLHEQLSEDKDELENIRDKLNRAISDRKKLESQRAELISLRGMHRAALDEARTRWQQTHEESHGIALQLEAASSQRASFEQSLKRGQLQISNLQNRCENLSKSLADTKSPLKAMQDELEGKLREKVVIEKALGEARASVQQIETELREKEQKRTQQEHQLQELRELLEQARLVNQESSVRLQTIEEQLKASGHELQETISSLVDDAEHAVWQERLESVSRKIQRLGPINLAAIDEYSQLSERKTYLDSQNDDLQEALKTLENAIRKIDKESRTRFKATFDKLNTNLQEAFPQLFGGGHAYLELTGDDLLETGVTIMAQPPGKRNSNIHLLSGGEKALVAVALVFSIFKLNPAPFCILDEVDAPLDDANVGRFSEMVKGMSTDVQFIFITHNKITMEIANQLLGVTMHEAGVSRLVSVDVDEAVEMAETA